MNKKKTLTTYLEVISMMKTGVKTGIITANGKDTINISQEELPRLLAIVESLIEISAVNGYEALTRVK